MLEIITTQQGSSLATAALAIAVPHMQQRELRQMRLVCTRLRKVASQFISRLNASRCKNPALRNIIPAFPGVKQLHIGWYGDICDETMTHVSRSCTNLELLSLRMCELVPSGFQHQITDASLTVLASTCTGLQSLDLGRCPRISDEGVISLARNCPDLIDLRISHASRVTDAALIALGRHCKKLRTLILRGCGRIGDTGIVALAQGCPLLHNFVCDYTHDVIDDGLLSLSQHCPNLRLLHIGTSDYGLEQMQGFSHLTELVITEGYEVTDRGVATVVQRCPSLQVLGLVDCPEITDRALNSLRNVTGLHKLVLSGYCESISGDGIAELRGRVPHLMVDASGLDIEESTPSTTLPVPPKRHHSTHSRDSDGSHISKTSHTSRASYHSVHSTHGKRQSPAVIRVA